MRVPMAVRHTSEDQVPGKGKNVTREVLVRHALRRDTKHSFLIKSTIILGTWLS